MLQLVVVLALVAAAFAARVLAPRIAGDAALPAAAALLSEGCFSLTPPPAGTWLTALRTLSVGASLRLPAALGGDVLFSADRVALSWPRLTRLRATVDGATVNACLDAASLTPHAMRLLLHLGLARCVPDAEAAKDAGAAADAPPAAAADATADAVAAAAAEGDAVLAALPRQLSLEPTAVELAGATLTFSVGSLFALDIILTPGAVLLPSFLADVLGGHVTLTLAGGAAAIRERAAALHTDAGAWTRGPPPPTTPLAAEPGARRPAALAGRPLAPVALRAETEHGGVAAAGWWTTTGLALREPATAALDFTSALVEGVIGHIHPLLAGAVKLEEDDVVRVRLEPARLHVPARAVVLHVAPMRLLIAPNPLILGSLALATRLNQGVGGVVGGALASPPRSPQRAASASSAAGRAAPSPSPSPSKNKLGLLSPSKNAKGAPPDRLEAWTSPICATLHADRLAVDSGRLDMLVSRNFAGGAGAVHLVMYGVVSMAAQKRALAPSGGGLLRRAPSGGGGGGGDATGLDMCLCLMTDSIGLPGDPTTGDPVPALRVPVRGTADAPRIGWTAATGDVFALLPSMVARAPGLGGVARWLGERRAARDAKRPPLPPAPPLPWAARLQRAPAARRDEAAGAPKAPPLMGRLVRSKKSKHSSLARRGGSLGKVFVRAPSK